VAALKAQQTQIRQSQLLNIPLSQLE